MTEPVKIEQKIIGYKVKRPEDLEGKAEDSVIKIEEPKGINEKVNREATLHGRTFKIKPANQNYSFYITINNQEVNGTLHPFEIFINSKSVEHFEYFSTITRLISAVFRKGGDINFIVDELTAIYSPLGGYWGKDRVTGKGKYFNSIMNEIGYVIEIYLNDLADINRCNVEEPKKYVVALEDVIVPSEGESIIVDCKKEYANAKQCPDCNNVSVVKMDGCDTCLECGFSRCG